MGDSGADESATWDSMVVTLARCPPAACGTHRHFVRDRSYSTLRLSADATRRSHGIGVAHSRASEWWILVGPELNYERRPDHLLGEGG
jgi:hypothetical protein